MRCVLGIDGGGTKTECVLVDEAGEIQARSLCGPSNPTNIGVAAAAAEMAKAGEEALQRAKLRGTDVAEICGGVAGSGEPNVKAGLERALKEYFPNANVAITSDLVLSLEATGELPSIVVLAGTGSAALGRTPDGRQARAGGFGPVIGDPGSAYDLGRRALALALQKMLNKEKFGLQRVLEEWGQCSFAELAERARANPVKIFPGIFPVVARAAEENDEDARALLRVTAEELGALAKAAIRQLGLEDPAEFFVGRTGGVFAGSVRVRKQFDEMVKEFAPKARVGELPRSVAETAGRLAHEALKKQAKFTA